jgi:DNA-binding response OmpR family regulator
VPDLVLLDIWMPDTDGITLLREWSVIDGYDCPVVMMSGHGTVETAVEATRLGAFDFVEKPLSLTKLLRTVERALDAGRRKRQSERSQGASLAVPIGKAKIRRAGSHVTLTAHSRMVGLALEAAELLAQDGIEAEVIDLRTLRPLDHELSFSSSCSPSPRPRRATL